MTFSDSLSERQYVSQYSITTVSLEVLKDGEVIDPDSGTLDTFPATFLDFFGDVYWVKVKMTSLDDQIIYFDRIAEKESVGHYQTTISSGNSSVPGIYKIVWEYSLDQALQIFVGLLEVGQSSHAYDSLDDGMKAIVESAWVRFADLFDSPFGGPNLQTYFQSHFNRGRMAQLLQVAVNRLNTIAQPHQTYSLDPNQNQFPYAKWGGLLDHALYVETIKHLRRSYVEQPLAEGVTVARLDRRDYMQRWGEILRDEEEDLKAELEVFKIANMGLGRPSVLVSGGAYGEWGPTRVAGLSGAPRGYTWTRGY